MNMKRLGLIVLCSVIVGCSAATVEHLLAGLKTTDTVLALVKIAVALSSTEHEHNNEGYDELEARYGVDLKPSVVELTDAAKELVETATTLRDDIKSRRGPSAADMKFAKELDRILPEDDS